MEVVNFYPQTLAEIPEQDSPITYGDECYLIYKEGENDIRATVAQIKPTTIEPVDELAYFNKEEDAVEYCNFLNSK